MENIFQDKQILVDIIYNFIFFLCFCLYCKGIEFINNNRLKIKLKITTVEIILSYLGLICVYIFVYLSSIGESSWGCFKEVFYIMIPLIIYGTKAFLKKIEKGSLFFTVEFFLLLFFSVFLTIIPRFTPISSMDYICKIHRGSIKSALEMNEMEKSSNERSQSHNINFDEIEKYFADNKKPLCPKKGRYVLNQDNVVICSIHHTDEYYDCKKLAKYAQMEEKKYFNFILEILLILIYSLIIFHMFKIFGKKIE